MPVPPHMFPYGLCGYTSPLPVRKFSDLPIAALRGFALHGVCIDTLNCPSESSHKVIGVSAHDSLDSGTECDGKKSAYSRGAKARRGIMRSSPCCVAAHVASLCSTEKDFSLSCLNVCNVASESCTASEAPLNHLKGTADQFPTFTLQQATKIKKGEYKRYLNKIYDETSWICGCLVRNALFCFPCVLLYHGEPLWSMKGVKDLGHLKEYIKIHSENKIHIANVLTLTDIGKVNIATKY
ncbi:hypothetical protein PR048_009329 [Dryococelus australis]|uniref:Uncharacterized protein n=1 Tax=Dryococelus australis TaxID=614101 RepID=A0ABQ9I0N7_9NEOP|nr:hypothetical protein PR048_009329 [Dryococelus australis]